MLRRTAVSLQSYASMKPQDSPRRSQPLAIHLAGELSIQTIDRAHAELIEAFETGCDIVASVGAEAQVDLTCVQLLEAARRTAQADGRAFALGAPAEGGLLEALQRGGFLQSVAQREFWLQDSGD
jgi:ABC-type transporter Mla MlaB component